MQGRREKKRDRAGKDHKGRGAGKDDVAMKKKGYKKQKKILYRYIKENLCLKAEKVSLEEKAERFENKAEYYKKRFRELGTNVSTLDPGNGYVKITENEINTGVYGTYAKVDNISDDKMQFIKMELAKMIAKELLESDIAQYIVKKGCENSPFGLGTIGVKLYVIPWEQMLSERTIKIRRFVDETLQEGETV